MVRDHVVHIPESLSDHYFPKMGEVIIAGNMPPLIVLS
jgi:hypothetical protein